MCENGLKLLDPCEGATFRVRECGFSPTTRDWPWSRDRLLQRGTAICLTTSPIEKRERCSLIGQRFPLLTPSGHPGMLEMRLGLPPEWFSAR